MNTDAKLLEKCINDYAASAPDKKKRQKEKVFKKGVLSDFSSEITNDWYIADLFDVTHLITCGVAKRPEYVDEGIPFLSAQNCRPFKTNLNKIRYIDKEAFEKITVGGKPEKDDVLYTRVGNCGEAAKIPYEFDFGVYVSLTLIKPVRGLLDTDYLVAFLNSRYGLMQAGQGAIGIGLKNLNVDNVRRYIIPLPPLAEQKQIATQLDQLLSQVNTLKNRLDNIPNILKRFRQSALAAAVSGKLTEEWRDVNNEIESPSIEEIKAAWLKENEKSSKRNKLLVFESLDNDLQALPNGWQWSQIGNIFDVHVGSTPSRKNEMFWGGTVSWVSSSEVNFCHIKATKETITEEGLANTSTSVHPPGTVLLAMIGQGKTRGQPAILDIHACHNQNTAALRILDKYCVSDYLYFFLYERYEETRRVGSGNNQKAMNKKIVQSLPFPLPPKEEQAEIVRQVEKYFVYADQIEKQVNSAQTRVNNLTQSILAKAFRGELTAEWREQNQDLISGENSAAALLEKIKVEKEALKSVRKVKRKKVA